MAGYDERGSARALSLSLCAEPGCELPQWTSEKRGKRFVHSAYCYEHANVPMLDVPAEPVRKQAGRSNPAAVFRKEVERQRLRPKGAA